MKLRLCYLVTLNEIFRKALDMVRTHYCKCMIVSGFHVMCQPARSSIFKLFWWFLNWNKFIVCFVGQPQAVLFSLRSWCSTKPFTVLFYLHRLQFHEFILEQNITLTETLWLELSVAIMSKILAVLCSLSGVVKEPMSV